MITELAIILFIVLFHELGHFIAASIFNWRINYIMLWIFGGVMKTEEHGNRPLHEETIVTLAGPFQHLLIYLIVLLFSSIYDLPSSLINTVLLYNTIILLFNLLPIWPLDGGKLLFFLFCLYKPFRQAHEWSILLSMIFAVFSLVIQLVYFPFTLSAYLIMLFILVENWTEWKQRHFVFMRFLLQRFDGQVSANKMKKLVVTSESKLMDILSMFMRNRTHAIYVDYPNNKRKVINEMDCLHSFFHDKNVHEPIGHIVPITI